MRRWLFGRVKLFARRISRQPGSSGPPAPAAEAALRPAGKAAPGSGGSHRRTRRAIGEVRGGVVVPAEPDAAGTGTAQPTGPDTGAMVPSMAQARPSGAAAAGAGPGRRPGGTVRPQSGTAGAGRAAVRIRLAGKDKAAEPQRRAQARHTARAVANATPWYETRQPAHTRAGMRHCGSLEPILHREWRADAPTEAVIVTAIDRLADLPQLIKEKLAAGLEGIHVGSGGVPDLDDMGELKGVPLPSGRATWDACAGAYGERKIVVGSRPSPSPDVMCHEIGHALDDIDGIGGQWQSDSPEFCRLHERCIPWLASDFHRQSGVLGRREFFADAFAAIASGQRPALVEMLAGDTRAALDVMLYFNVRYGI